MELSVNLVSEAGSWYAPDFKDNREKPSDEQMAVQIFPLSGRELKKLQSETKSAIRPKNTSEFLTAIEDREAKVKEDILRKKTGQVRNLRTRDAAGQVKQIEKSEDLIELCLSGPAELLGLLSDIFDAIVSQSKLEEGLLGK